MRWIEQVKSWLWAPFELIALIVFVCICLLAEWLDDYGESTYRSSTSSDND